MTPIETCPNGLTHTHDRQINVCRLGPYLDQLSSQKLDEATGKALGFQAEVEDVDSLGSDTVARSLLAQSKPSSLREATVGFFVAFCGTFAPVDSTSFNLIYHDQL